MKLSGTKMSIRVMSVENCEIHPTKTILHKKMKRGGVRTRLTKMLRSTGTTFITRQMIDKLIEAEKKKHNENNEHNEHNEHNEDHEEDVEQVTEPDSKNVENNENNENVENVENNENVENVENEPNYGMVGQYFDPQNLSVVSPDGVMCTDVLEKAARISAWWTRVLGYKVY